MKAPGIGRFKLKNHKPLSSFAFNFNLRRYTVVAAAAHGDFSVGSDAATAAGLTLPYLRVMAACGAEGAARVPFLPVRWVKMGEDPGSVGGVGRGLHSSTSHVFT